MACVLALPFFFATTAYAKSDLPAFSGPVVDDANVVPDGVEQTLEDQLNYYQQRSGNQIAVAVVKTTGDQSVEDYSIDLARAWGVGQKDKDTGVLILIAYDDRKLRIEVGRGLEGRFTDLQAGRIIREQMTPRLKTGDVGGAIEAGTLAVRGALGDAVAVPVPPPASESGGGGSPFALIFAVVAVASVVARFGRRRRFGWAAPIFFGGGPGGFGGGHRPGGFGGGGFGGGGGGGFGGGGASGRW